MENSVQPENYVNAFEPSQTDVLSVNQAVAIETGNANVTEIESIAALTSTAPELIQQESNSNWLWIGIAIYYLIF